MRGPHGGYLATIILRALTQAVDDPGRAIRSFSTQYVAPPTEAGLTIHTTIERAGKSMTFVSARTQQEDRLVALSLGAFSLPWQGLAFEDAPMPDVAGLEDAFPVPNEGEGIPAFLGNFDMRWAIGERPFSGADRAEVGGWLRMAEPIVADAPVVATYMDAWAPAVFPRAAQPVIAPTIDLTIHFRNALPVAGSTAEDFYLGRFRSTVARDGFFEEDGELWTKDGLLVAQSRQLALALT